MYTIINALLFILLLKFTQFIVSAPIQDDFECLLRDQSIGVCRSVENCPHAKNILSKKFGTPSTLISCGYDGTIKLVCCRVDKILEDNSGGLVQNMKKSPSLSRSSTDTYLDFSKKTDFLTPKDLMEPSGISKALIACNEYKQQRKRAVSTHIIYGRMADDGQFPHMAALGYLLGDELFFRCGSTLISDRFLITAAHCVRNEKRKLSVARLGTYNLRDTRVLDTDYNIEDIILHKYNARTRENDIALMKLHRPVQFSKHVYPACLYQKESVPSKVIVTGWGKTENKTLSENLLHATLNIVPFESCQEKYKHIYNLTSSQLCAVGEGKEDACEGDSGGPLQDYNEENKEVYDIIGITSFSAVRCSTDIRGIPAVYTKISKYTDWIEEHVWP